MLFNAHAVYLGHQGAGAQCPAHAFGKVEALQIEALATASPATTRLATASTTVAGVPAKIYPFNSINHTFDIVLSQAGVVIHLSYGRAPNLAQSFNIALFLIVFVYACCSM